MIWHNAREETGLALAHVVRVRLRIVVSAVVLLAHSPAGAQTAAGQVVAPPPAAAVASSDTILMKQVASDRNWWQTVATIAGGLMSISILVLTAALVPAAWNFRKNHKMIRHTIEKFQGDIAPILRNASSITDDVNYISTSVRADVQRMNQTVAAANRQLLEAVKKAEERVNDFNALLTVAQEEAESAFISTAAAIRGISTGAAALGGDRAGRRARRSRHADARDRDLRESMAELRAAIDEDLHEAVDDVGPALDDSFRQEDEPDVYNDGRATDSGSEAPRAAGEQRPRTRSGPGTGGAV